MSLLIPLRAIPNQTLQVQLNNQACTIDVFQTAFALFLTLFVNNSLIVTSVICENRNRIVRSTYLGFIGDLCFEDTQGDSDPVYTGLGDATARFQLVYLEPADLPAGA